jgi:hypothetical protein
MDMKSSMTAAAQHRAWGYWFEDGLPILMVGFGFVVFGLSEVFDHPGVYVDTVLGVLYLIILCRYRPILEWLKARLTYPRTGYVPPPYSPQFDRPWGQDLRMILVFFVIMLACINERSYIHGPWIYAAWGLEAALVLWIMNGKDCRLSWITIAAIPLIGFYLALCPPDAMRPSRRLGYLPDHRLGYFLTAVGLLFLADGAAALVRYLWRNPVVSGPAK